MISEGYFNMDCFDGLPLIDDKSVDMILCDLPFGTTNCGWDILLPLNDYVKIGKKVLYEKDIVRICRLTKKSLDEGMEWFEINKQKGLWTHYKRIIKDNGAIVLFSSQPFTTDLVNSNRRWFKYELIWKKTLPTNFLNANRQPLRAHENICVFYKKQPTYHPQMKYTFRNDIGRCRKNGGAASQYHEFRREDYKYVETGERYPTDVLEFSNWNGALFGNTENATKHSTQKPLPLLKELIQTYTDEGDLIVDNCAGSASTGIAAHDLGRRYILFEKNKKIYETGNQRLTEHRAQLNLFELGLERKYGY